MLAVLLAAALAAPVPKAKPAPLPAGLAGDWVVQAETDVTPKSVVRAAHIFQKGSPVVVWSFDGGRVRVSQATLADAETVDEGSKKEVRAYRIAWDKEKPELISYALDKPESKDEPPANLWRLSVAEGTLTLIHSPADPTTAPADFELPPNATRSLKRFAKLKAK